MPPAGRTSSTCGCPNTAGASSSPIPVVNRTIGFGDFFGQPVWQEVPGEFRNQLRRLIVTQGDTEPASVEQQRWLGHRCPSLYDMRNLFQVNVEEGRHLWAMVYLLHSYFGRDGRDEAEELLARQSGNRDKPRILEAFNEPIDTWLDFFMFTMFTDRDGKSQLLSLSESSLDPLSRTTRFMLTEEAHHMFVGETGIAPHHRAHRAQLMKAAGFSEDVRAARRHRPADDPEAHQPLVLAEPRPARQRDLDQRRRLLRQRPEGPRRGRRSGRSTGSSRPSTSSRPSRTARSSTLDVPMRNAMNEVLRDWYVDDCQAGVDRWNKILERHGLSDRLRLPGSQVQPRHRAVRRRCTSIRTAGCSADEEWKRRKHEWLPDAGRQASSCCQHHERADLRAGRFANYIAPPRARHQRQAGRTSNTCGQRP